jgi:hypothetical protein
MGSNNISNGPSFHEPNHTRIGSEIGRNCEEPIANQTPLPAKMVKGLSTVRNVYETIALKLNDFVFEVKFLLVKLVEKLSTNKQPQQTEGTHASQKGGISIHREIAPKSILIALTLNGHTDPDAKMLIDFISRRPQDAIFSSDNVSIKGNKLLFQTPVVIEKDNEAASKEVRVIKEIVIDDKQESTDDFLTLFSRLYILDPARKFNNLEHLAQMMSNVDPDYSYEDIRFAQDLPGWMNDLPPEDARTFYTDHKQDCQLLLREYRAVDGKLVYFPKFAPEQFAKIRAEINRLQAAMADLPTAGDTAPIPNLPNTNPPTRIEHARSIFINGMLQLQESGEEDSSSARLPISPQHLSSQTPVAMPSVRHAQSVSPQNNSESLQSARSIISRRSVLESNQNISTQLMSHGGQTNIPRVKNLLKFFEDVTATKQ